MGLFPTLVRPRLLVAISTVVALLLAIRFSSSAALAAMNLSAETLASAGRVFEIYEILLPFPLLAVFVLLGLSNKTPLGDALVLGVVLLHFAALISWLYGLNPFDSPSAKSLFPPLAMAAVASSSFLSLRLSKNLRDLRRGWAGWAHFTLLLIVPLVFAMRVAASLGVGTSPAPSGVLQGNWFFVNSPTLLLELLAVAVWLNVVLDSDPSQLRRRWYAFIPFTALPVSLAAFALRPLSGYILSALITWGSNLALFAPAPLSLSLAVIAVSCYLSSFLLIGRKGNGEAWGLLLLGTASVVLAGFYPSMASVEGLSIALLVSTAARLSWKRVPS